MNGILLEFIGGIFCFFLWLYSVHCLYKAYNITVITENTVRTVRSPFFYMFDGDVTLKRNKNKRIKVTDTLYITHTFGVEAAKIGDTYLILSNYPLEEDYSIHDDQNALVIISSEEILNALRENFDCCEVNDLREIVEEKGLYRIVATPQGEGYKEVKKIVRSDLHLSLSFFVFISSGLSKLIKDEDILYRIMINGLFVFSIFYLLYGMGYFSVTKDSITEVIFPCIPFRRTAFKDYAEAGLYTLIERKPSRHGGHMKDYYTHYFYFSPRILTDEERENISKLPKDEYKKIIYNEFLHTYLTETLGIELKGKLTEKGKN